MFVEYRLQEVTRAKDRAFSIFTRTMAKFERAIEKANKYLEHNRVEMERHEAEVTKRAEANLTIRTHIESMNKSISQIKHIVGE